MPAPSIRPAADPLDDIDRESTGVDSSMARQDRADLPGERSAQAGKAQGDVYVDATREVSQRGREPEDGELDPERVIAGEADVDLVRDTLAPAGVGLGADDDDPIDETERAGDDSLR